MSRTPTREQVQQAMATAQALWTPMGDPAPDVTADQIAVTRLALQQSLARLDRIKTNCHNCKHFHIEECGLHNARIPHEFQTVEGQCADWRFDGVPFS